MKKIFLFLTLLLQTSLVFPNYKITTSEAGLLVPLFKLLLEHTEIGYVIYDKKPVCTIAYDKHPHFFQDIEPFDVVGLATFVAKDVFNNDLFSSGNIVFHFAEKDEMLVVINRKLFLKTVKESLPLFQYVLGPAITPESLLNVILGASISFCETLNYDRVLIGIVLGYGIQNALFKSRLESIQCDAIPAKDVPPFSAKADFCAEEEREILLLSDVHENSKWKKDRKLLRPSHGFSSIKEEIEDITQKIATASEKLMMESPRFIFGCIKENAENQKLLRDFEDIQDQIRNLLKSENCIEASLEMICGEKVEIEKTEIKKSTLAQMDINVLIAKLLKTELKKYDSKYLSFFVEGLLELGDDKETGGNLISFPGAIENIRQAKTNLEDANQFFRSLKKKRAFICVFEPFLYYKTLREGNGPCLKDETKVCVDYEILNPKGKCLNDGHLEVLDLRDTIPGFAHGLKDMKEGETREIFIHPALGYGVHTFSEKGIYLKAGVTLHKIGGAEGELSLLDPLDLSFIQKDQYLQQCVEGHKRALRFIGKKKREFLKLCPAVDIDAVAKTFKSLNDDEILSKEESVILNQFFWNFYFAR